MVHRHLNHDELTLAAIDDVIARGKWADWMRLRRDLADNVGLREDVRRVCRAHVADPYAQRYHFWNNYVSVRVA